MKFRNTDAVSQIICSNKSSKWLLSPLSVMTNASFSTEPPWVPGFKQMKGKFAICQNLGRFFSFFKLNLSAFIWYALIIFLVSYWIKWKAENRIDASDKTELRFEAITIFPLTCWKCMGYVHINHCILVF